MSRRTRITALACILAIWFVVLATLFVLRHRDSYTEDMQPVYALIAAGKQNWGADASDLLHKMMARSWNRHALADHLVKERDGSLVAEGMVLAVQSGHPQARRILHEHLTDKRWNWALANNDELAKELLNYLDGHEAQKWVTSWLQETATAQ